MPYPWISEYCLNKPYAQTEYKPSWDAQVYTVGGKIFAYTGHDGQKKPILNLKLEPVKGLSLRHTYQNKIVAGYHTNKEHWNTLYLESDVPDDTVESMIDESYMLILHSLSKKKQKELEEESHTD